MVLWATIWLWPTASDEVRFGLLPALAGFVGVAGLVWFAVSIRCVACHGRVGWYAVRRLEISKCLYRHVRDRLSDVRGIGVQSR